jgi:ADP-ribose pyrophosphatase YjhB (NUDIX family)
VPAGAPLSVTRDFTVATFVVDGDRVLLLFHRKLRMWLPPGGHIEPHELPDEAAVREVLEETGVRAVLVGETALPIDAPRQLVRPEGIQLEPIGPGHEHIDLIYYAVPTGGAITESVECDKAGWYRLADLAALGVNDEVRTWSARAVEVVAARLKGNALVAGNGFA